MCSSMGIGFYGFLWLYDFDSVRLFRFLFEAFEEQADTLLYVGNTLEASHRRVGGQLELLRYDLRVVRTDGFVMVQARKLAEGRQHLGKGVGIARCPSHGEALLTPLHEEKLTPLPGDLPQVAEADFQQAHVLVSLREAHLVLQAQLRHDSLVRVSRMA